MKPRDITTIKLEDRENLEKVVDVFKKYGLHISLTGSALEEEDYKDIDLVLTSLLSTQPLNEAINELREKFEIDLKERNSKTAVDQWREKGGMGVHGDTLGPYVDSVISARYIFNMGDSLFDVSYSKEPFGLNPEAKRINLD
jgi:hypothetical protein